MVKKDEVLALGVPEDKIREFQTLYNRDLDSRMKHPNNNVTKEAILSMLPMIQEEKNAVLEIRGGTGGDEADR